MSETRRTEIDLGPGQYLRIGDGVFITINARKPSRVKLGVSAEPGVPVERGERAERMRGVEARNG